MGPTPPTRSRPLEPQFLLELPRQRMEGALGASLGSHLALGLLVLLCVRYLAPADQRRLLAINPPALVWLVGPGPGGGGGGGGNTNPDPPRKAEIQRADPAPIHTAPPEPQPVDRPPVDPNPARVATDIAVTTPGALDSIQSTSLSRGPGSGGGGDVGDGPGIGPTRGPGLGPGADRGTGGETFRPGNGVTVPRVLREVKPAYTAEAMRAKVQVWSASSASCCPTGPSVVSAS